MEEQVNDTQILGEINPNYKDYVLYVDDLSIEYTLGTTRIFAVNHVTFGIRKNESIGIVGESGCGKSTLAMAMAHILPPNARVTSGRVYFKGQVVVSPEMGASYSIRYDRKERKIENQLSIVRWKGISVIFQGALDSLNPVHKVGTQLSDIFIYRESMKPEEAEIRSKQLLSAVGLDDWVYGLYPHQLSGGMKQRVVIAMAISLNPALIIADEPTTSLDVITQYRIMEELLRLRKAFGVALVSISHDIALISRLSDRLMVMYAGILVEKLPSNSFDVAQHPYTHLLVNSIPKLEEDIAEVQPIRGSPPRLTSPLIGCPFFERCDYAIMSCKEDSAAVLRETQPYHEVACSVLPAFVTDNSQVQEFRKRDMSGSKMPEQEVVLEASGLTRIFQKRTGIREIATNESNKIIAVSKVNLTVRSGETVALVGETGSGKTTLSRMLGLLDTPTDGFVKIMGEPVNLKKKKQIASFRKIVQTIFQDPFQSINPRFPIASTVAEPLSVNRGIVKDQPSSTDGRSRKYGFGSVISHAENREKLVVKALQEVELTPPEDYLEKYPHQLSGGQRQRVSIARGLIVDPKILIADEPISMLDVSLRAGILNLMRKLKQDFGISVLYITHDVASARYLSDRIYVMYKGEIVETGETEDLIRKSAHPYTIALLLASIGIEGSISEKLGERIFSQSEASDNKGCLFAPRCQFAKDICSTEKPELMQLSQSHSSRCHFAQDIQGMGLTEIKAKK
jgi:peptide/nickel transport system ATP-binding protein